jgi:coiled-coil domain-containing protein 39
MAEFSWHWISGRVSLQVLMNWNQEELEQWALTQQQKEEDADVVARYTAQDDSKVKELSLAVERASAAVVVQRADLMREVTDTQAAQVQLDKAADDFARLHKVRWPLATRSAQSQGEDPCIQNR